MKVKSLTTLVFFLVVLYSCKQKENSNLEEMARRSAHPEAVLVKSVKLEPSTFYHELISNGKAYSSQKAVLPFKVSGTIKEINVVNGQKVEKGQLLATIEDFEYKEKLKSAKVSLEKARMDFTEDILSYNETTDTTKIQPSKVQLSSVRSGLSAAVISNEEAEYNYNNTRIFAPFSGTIANLEAKPFNPSSKYTSLCTIINDETMEVEFNVIESEYGFIDKNMPVGIIPFINDSTQIAGMITNINPQVDNNGMVKVTAEFSNNNMIIDGMNVKVVIRKPVSNRLVVPKEALVIRQGKDVIFVRQDSLAIWKYVTVEFENSTSLSIKEGLTEGDMVIYQGNVNLAHETIVREQ